MNIDRCCNCGTNPPNPCPAPCIAVDVSGIIPNFGGLEDPCYLSGGVVAVSSAGVNGEFIIEYNGGYSATFPVSIAAIVSDGGETDYSRYIGGNMTIEVGVGACVNGVIESFTTVSIFVELFAIDSLGNYDEGPYFSSIFSHPFGTEKQMGTSVENSNVRDSGGCVVPGLFAFHYDGLVTVRQPAECTLPPVYHFAQKCDDPQTRIIVDLTTQPNAGAATCLYSGERYRPTNDWTTKGSPVSVTWSNDICPLVQQNPIGRACIDYDQVVAYDPTTQPAEANTFFYDSVQYYPTGETENLPASSVTWSTDECPGLNRIGRTCGNSSRTVVYDPTTKPVEAITFFYDGIRYYPTTIETNLPPQLVIWSNTGCLHVGPRPSDPCHDPACDAASPNFPECCNRSEYSLCPQCIHHLTGNSANLLRSLAGSKVSTAPQSTDTTRRSRFSSDAELDALGLSPDQIASELKQGGGCGCDPPSI